MAMAVGMMELCGSAAASSSASSVGGGGALKGGRRRRRGGDSSPGRVRCVASSYSAAASGLTDQYRTLKILPGASENEVKKAFRQLALQYHPDVCKGSNCGVQFHRINEAYDIVMNNLRGSVEEENQLQPEREWNDEDPMRGMYDSSWDMWEEWMGWEGAGIRDYSSHINPYI